MSNEIIDEASLNAAIKAFSEVRGHRPFKDEMQAALAALEPEPQEVDLEIGTDAIYQAALNRAAFSNCQVNDTREFSRLLAKACAEAWGVQPTKAPAQEAK